MPGADSYPEGTTALATDSEQRSLVKICSLIASGAGGGGGGDSDWSSVSGAYGAGNQPPALTTARGQGYNTSDDSVHYWYGSAWH